ncbi:hypothetical protein E4A41_12760, partial [Micrococcus endophyticus]
GGAGRRRGHPGGPGGALRGARGLGCSGVRGRRRGRRAPHRRAHHHGCGCAQGGLRPGGCGCAAGLPADPPEGRAHHGRLPRRAAGAAGGRRGRNGRAVGVGAAAAARAHGGGRRCGS